jgi:hypothetical protein
MFGMGDYEFVGYLVQKKENLLLVFVPDEIPDDENAEENDAGVYIKADMSGVKLENERDLERLEPGRMLMGLGRLTIQKDKLPEVYLNTLLVMWRKREGLTIPSFLIETILEDVQVSSHLRNLPAGMHASEEQVRKALKAGIILPDGYTYVSDHERKYEKTKETDQT